MSLKKESKEEITATEVLILVAVVIIGIATFGFYSAGILFGYQYTPLLAVSMIVLIGELVIVLLLFRILRNLEKKK